jgi:hypothetical protein
MKKYRRNIGQFSIIAALLVSIILVTGVIITYSMIRNNPSHESPKVLASIGEMNLAVKRILEFTVGYYGSILQVTGNWSYAQQLASRYLQSGLVNIADSHPDWNPSFKVNFQQVSTRWFTPVSYSMGNISVTYSMSGLGIGGVNYTTSSLLKVTFLKPVNSGEARFNVAQEGNEPELGLSKENFFFYNYSYSQSTWILVHPNSDPVAFSNGTYVLQIPSGVDQNAYSIQVADPRAITATAFYSGQSLTSGIPQYSYTFTWNQTLYSSLTKDTLVVEALQNGTLRWLGQNLLTNGEPIPPFPVKALHVNETVGGVNREVPFQVEDWGSNYRVPLSLTSNASVFNSRNMIVFLVNHKVQKVTFWWDGRDTAKQTSYAWTNRYFKDNPANSLLTNGILSLTVGNFIITASVGSTTSSSQFLRINSQNPTYGADPAYVIYNGTVRDIVQQEAEWGYKTGNCPNVYSQIYLTLPANATYYTYATRLIFINSSQSRTITDLSAIQLSVSGVSQRTENGTSGGYPISSTATGLFYNFTSPSFQTGWAHHWSEFISGSSGTGIMFTDNANQKLYVFDKIAGQKTGALNVISSSRIELNPVARSQYPASFTYPLDVTWHGAVVTFNNDPMNTIYPTSGNIGLWVMVENPPKISMITGNNVSITVTSSPSGSGYVKVDGNAITTPAAFNWTIGSNHTLQALSPVAGPAGTRYVWTGWSDGGAQNHTYTVPASNAIITANWQTQYQVTFNYQVIGGGSGYSAPSVNYTSLGSQHSVTANSSAVWVDSGSTYTYTNNPLTGSGASERWYASSGTSGTISSSTTINPTFYHQYYLTVSSAYGSPTGQGWYNAGSSASFGVTTPASGGAGIQYVFTSWSGSGSGSYSGSSSSQSVTMNNPITETANWQTQYYLTVLNGGHGTASGQGWYNAGANASFSISPTTVSGGTGIQYVFTNWVGSGTGSYTGSASSSSVTMNNPITETANWKTQYQVSFAVSPSGSGSTSPSGTNIWYDAASTISISASANSGYHFLSWSATSGITITNPKSASTTATINAAGTITATFTKLALDGSAMAFATSGSSFTISLTTTQPNDLLYVSVVSYNSYVSSISGGGLTWTCRQSSGSTISWPYWFNTYYLSTWYAVWSSSGTITITVTMSGSTSSAAAVAFGINGANTASPFDGSYASATGGYGTSASVSKSTSNANDMIIGAIGVSSGFYSPPTLTVGTGGSGFTLVNTATQGSGSYCVETSDEYQIVSTTQSNLAVGYTWSGSYGWGMVADAIEQAS